jgi:hypothetical protein
MLTPSCVTFGTGAHTATIITNFQSATQKIAIPTSFQSEGRTMTKSDYIILFIFGALMLLAAVNIDSLMVI